MLKQDYFKKALKNKSYIYRNWLISVFCNIVENPYEKKYPYKLTPKDQKMYFQNEKGTLEEIEDYEYGKPLIDPHDPLTVFPEDIPNLAKKAESTYGILFSNYYMLVYCFGDKIPYINGPFNVKDIEKIIVKSFSDDPKEGEPLDKNKFYVFEREKLAGANFNIEFLCGVLITNVSERSFVGSENNIAIRNKLVDAHKGDINDPVLGAKIDDAIVQEQKRYIKEDPDGTKHFYGNDSKGFEALKRMHGAFGYEAAFTEEQEGRLILKSLDEGFDVEDLPALINGARSGSDSRANETQDGGAASKASLRGFQNDIIEGEDCGTRLGLKMIVLKRDTNNLIGHYYVGPNGSPIAIDKDNVKSLYGKELVIRLPSRCNNDQGRTCMVCAGKSLSRNKRSPPIATASVGTGFLKSSLKKMHTAQAELSRYEPELVIS